jgi:hypothetical protein
MRGVQVVVAAAVAAATIMLSASTGWAQTKVPASPSVLFFAGTDLWRQGQFVHGGVLLAPSGLDADGFTLKLLIGGGDYRYYSGGLGQDVDGRVLSASAMPGWRFRREAFTVTLFGGLDVQDHRLTPDDPGGRLDGFYVGARLGGEVWYQPVAQFMAAADASLATTGPAASLHAATGWRFFDAAFIGPETQMFWSDTYRQLRFGVHITGLRTDMFEWSAGGGWASDSDGHEGPYLRLGVIARY